MTSIGGYVNMDISDQHVQCLRCEKEVRVNRIDNLLEIDPTEYTIMLHCDPCECGFTTVLEYLVDWKFSYNTSVDESGGQDKWMAQKECEWKIYDLTEEEK